MINLPRSLPFLVAICLLATGAPLLAQAPTTQGIAAHFAEVQLDPAMEQCSELVFSEDAGPMDRARAVAMLALAYHLQDLPDAADRIGQLQEVCADDNRLDRAVLLPVLAFLAGEQSAAAMTAAIDTATPDWQAFGILCRYVMTVRTNPDPRVLHEIYRDYADATAIMARGDWAAAWAERVPQWQKSLQDKQAQTPMEPLVARRMPDPNREQEAAAQALAARAAAFAAVSRIVEANLDNRTAEAVRQAKEAAQNLSGLTPPEADAFRKLLAYLGGDQGAASRDIFQRAQSDPPLWALACVAMFARDVAAAKDTAALDQVMLLNHLDNFHGNLGHARSEPTVAQWEKQSREWEAWCTGNFASRPGLPPLLASRSGKGGVPAATTASPAPSSASTTVVAPAGNFPPLAEVTPEQFAEGRGERFKGRPRPADLTFDEAQLKRYLASLPADLQEVERKRAEIVGKIKPHLVHIFARNPYRGEIKLRTRTRRGIISMANENILVFKATERGKPQRIKWSDLAIDQYAAFLEHFARQRTGATGGQIGPAESKLNAANDYLAMALLCDWYELYDKALKHAQQAVATAPALEPNAARLILP